MSALKISIPKLTPGHELSIGSQPDEIKSWIEALPLFDAITTIQEALPVLIELNRTEMDNTLRFNTMQLFSQALQHPIAITRKKYLAIHPPLTGKHKEASTHIKQLLNEMAGGYKIIINSHTTDSNQRISIQEITQTIYSAIHYIGRLLLDKYLCYESQAPSIWMELTNLFKFATSLCVETAPLDVGEKKQTTIEQAYLQILLLVAIHPYRLTHGEATLVYHLMKDWSRHCKLLKPPVNWKPTNELIVKATAYGLVSCAKKGAQLSDLKDIRIINIDRLKAFMKTHCENGKGASSTLSERLMRNMFTRLLEGWHASNVRKSTRTHCKNKIEIILGLNACYLAFGGKCPKADQPTHMKMRLIPIDGEYDDPWAPIINDHQLDAGDESKFNVDDPMHDVWDKQTLRPSTKDLPKTPTFKRYAATQTDYSAMGLSVHFDFSSGLKPCVGDLISFRSGDSEQDEWQLGAIRWMEFSQEKGTLGIKLFSYAPSPIAIKALIGVGRGGDLMQSLLLSPKGLNHPDAKIIVPASVYDTGTQLYAELHKNPAKITLTTLHDFSNSFACFSYRRITQFQHY